MDVQVQKIRNAHYIKLCKGAEWAEDCFKNGKIRFGWSYIEGVEDINNRRWDIIETQVRNYFEGKKNGATQDYEALKRICEATEQDIFITFHKGIMYWCCPSDSPIEQDSTSKYRKCITGWSNKSINENSKVLFINDISGKITKTQGFQATSCQFKSDQVEILERIINGNPNPIVLEIEKKGDEIIELIESLIEHLYWKDCEILADLIFQRSGWQRNSIHGGNMEFMDMEYIEPITNYRYIVQVKSGADFNGFKDFLDGLNSKEFHKGYFVVFNPKLALCNYVNERTDIELIFGKKLAKMIFDLGLVSWLLKKSY